MKLLVVLALVTVAVCLTEGLLVSKCDLREHLMNATALRLPPKAQHHMTNEDFVAKIVCHVEKTSGFDTAAVNTVNIDEDGKLTGRKKRCAKHEHGSKSDSHEEVNHEAEWTLYGLFQLSDHLICKSDADTSSVNLCEMDCADLINEDITDDIDCLEMIKMKLENGSEHREAVFMMAKLLFDMDCAPVNAAEYFKDC